MDSQPRKRSRLETMLLAQRQEGPAHRSRSMDRDTMVRPPERAQNSTIRRCALQIARTSSYMFLASQHCRVLMPPTPYLPPKLLGPRPSLESRNGS